MAKKRRKKGKVDWAEAQRRCRLSDEEVRMAKEVGMSPRSLTSNMPNRAEPWKAPVKDWIRNLYERLERKRAKKKAATQEAPATPRPDAEEHQ